MTPRLFTALAIASTSVLAQAPGVAAQETTSITVALPVNLCLANWPFFVAAGEGMFAAEGLEVSMEGLDGSSAAIQAMLAGQAQIAASAPADLLAASGAGADIGGFYSFYQYLPFRLVTPAGSAVTSLADLEGKTIGISSASGGDAIYMRSLMSFANIAPDKYEELAVGEGNMAATALTDGVVDAYSASFVEEIVFGGMGIAYTPLSAEGYPATTGLLLAAQNDFITANPKVIEGLGRGLARATAAGLASRDLVIATCTAVAPQETEDPGFATAVLDGVEKLLVLGDAAGGKYGHIDEPTWATYRSLIVSVGIAEAAAEKTAVSNAFVAAWNQ